jgi:acetyltransferase-like isoleucine patch superfamily enzyme
MLKSVLNGLLQTWRSVRLRVLGLALETPRLLAGGIDVRAGYGREGAGRIAIGPSAWIERGVVLHAFGGSIRIGGNCFLGPHTVIYGHGGVDIGDACLIAMHCRIVSSNHAVPPIGTDIRSLPDELRPTRIGRDVWLGAGVTVLGGVDIGDGCIVGAGAVVTKSLPPGAICHGVPARVTGWRSGAAPERR